MKQLDESRKKLGLDRRRWFFNHALWSKSRDHNSLSVALKAKPYKLMKKDYFDKDIKDYMFHESYRKMVLELRVPENVHSLRSMRISAAFGYKYDDM